MVYIHITNSSQHTTIDLDDFGLLEELVELVRAATRWLREAEDGEVR